MYVELIKDSYPFKAGTQFKVESSIFCDYTIDQDYYYGTVRVKGEDVRIEAKWSQCKHISDHEFINEVIPEPPRKYKEPEWDSYINYP